MKITRPLTRIIKYVDLKRIQSPSRYKKIIQKYLAFESHPKLQIGCGPYRLPGWLNTDIAINACKAGAMFMDAGEVFPFPDNCFDCVYSEHIFEHLTHEQAVNMLKESYRVLKASGTIRIATPDFRFLEDLYLHPENPLNKRYIEWSAAGGGNVQPVPVTALNVINKFHTFFGHKIIYDQETLTNLLRDNGFRNIRVCEIGHSSKEELNNVESHFNSMPYEFYQLETMILEADKM